MRWKTSSKPALAYTHPHYPQVAALDPALRGALEAFRQAGPAGIYVSSMEDAQRWLTLDVNDDREVAFYLYDRCSGETTLLGKDASQAFADKLGRMQPVEYTARDGLTLHGYLPLPATLGGGVRGLIIISWGVGCFRARWEGRSCLVLG